MEERNTTLFKNLNMMYQAEVAMLVSIILLIIPVIIIRLVAGFMVLIAATISMIAVFVMLIAVIISIVALVGLRNVHRDYYSAIGVLILGVLLTVFGGQSSKEAAAFLLETGGSIAKLIQSYLIIRATNSLLTELGPGQERNIRRGKLVWYMLVFNGLVGIVTDVIPTGDGLMLLLVIAVISLVLGVVAWVLNITYLKASSEAFRDAISPETV